jgi:DNA-binding response OmpR family regulator
MPVRIAVVHSDASVAELLVTLLEDEGYEPVTYGDPNSALDLMKLSPPELAVVELSLFVPEANLVDALRGEPSTAHIPILALTTASDVEAVRPASCQENCEILTEPFDINSVIGLVRSLLKSPGNYQCG